MAKAGLLFVGTDDGIVLFSDPGGTGRWLRIGQELHGRRIRAVWPAVDTPLVVLVAVEGAGLQRSADGGQSWQEVLDADVRSLTGHPRDPQALYLGTANGEVHRSADDGQSWELCSQGERPATGAECHERALAAGVGRQRECTTTSSSALGRAGRPWPPA